MGEHKRRKNTDFVVESKPVDVNKPTANEENARYMANPAKGFWKAFREFFQI